MVKLCCYQGSNPIGVYLLSVYVGDEATHLFITPGQKNLSLIDIKLAVAWHATISG